MKTVVGYIRVSTNGQAQEDKYGIEAQKRDILDYCARNNLALTKWYVDGGVSGVEEERPELDKILYNDEEVANPPIQAVVVAKSDRLARDMNLYYYYKFVLKKKNIELISVSEDFGAMGAFAGVMESLTLFIAEQERINIAKRTNSGRRIKARAGGYAGGRAPYGYKVKDGQLALDEREAEIVRIVFEKREKGATLQDIADWLNDHGYQSRSGKRFYPSQIRSILNNRKTYEGYYSYADIGWVKGIHEPILEVKD